MKKHYRHENNCLNCGTDLQGKFCHHCGQENLEIKESFGHMLNHAVSDYFHFDHQFFHTLKPLFFAPGKLTNEYMAGRRTQFLHPVKMYIFISLIFFVLLLRENKEEKRVAERSMNNEQLADTLTAAINKNEDLDPATKAQINNGIKAGIAKNEKSKKKHKVRISTNWNKASDYEYDLEDNAANRRGGIFHMTKDSTYEGYVKRQAALPDSSKDDWLKRGIIKKNFDYTKYGSRAKEVFLEDFKHNIPKLMFVLLPLFALILKLSFVKNHKFYVEHLIYAIHLHCFLFLFIAVVMIIRIMLPHSLGSIMDWVELFSTIAIIYYVYKSLKAVYHRSRARTISKMLGIGFAYSLAFILCITGLLIITALTAA